MTCRTFDWLSIWKNLGEQRKGHKHYIDHEYNGGTGPINHVYMEWNISGLSICRGAWNTDKVSSCPTNQQSLHNSLITHNAMRRERERESVVLKLLTEMLSIPHLPPIPWYGRHLCYHMLYIIHFKLYIYKICSLIKIIFLPKALCSPVIIKIVHHDHQSQTKPLTGRTDSYI